MVLILNRLIKFESNSLIFHNLMINQSIIDAVGWIYFAAWSLSFYGQLILNFKLKRYS